MYEVNLGQEVEPLDVQANDLPMFDADVTTARSAGIYGSSLAERQLQRWGADEIALSVPMWNLAFPTLASAIESPRRSLTA